MKIRLYRGPFNGKVMEHRDAGNNEIIVSGPKPMTRKQRYEWWQAEQYRNPRSPINYTLSNNGKMKVEFPNFPTITARYRLVQTTRPFSGPITSGSFKMMRGVCMHPDGSLFYEWINPNESMG